VIFFFVLTLAVGAIMVWPRHLSNWEPIPPPPNPIEREKALDEIERIASRTGDPLLSPTEARDDPQLDAAFSQLVKNLTTKDLAKAQEQEAVNFRKKLMLIANDRITHPDRLELVKRNGSNVPSTASGKKLLDPMAYDRECRWAWELLLLETALNRVRCFYDFSFIKLRRDPETLPLLLHCARLGYLTPGLFTAIAHYQSEEGLRVLLTALDLSLEEQRLNAKNLAHKWDVQGHVYRLLTDQGRVDLLNHVEPIDGAWKWREKIIPAYPLETLPARHRELLIRVLQYQPPPPNPPAKPPRAKVG
jgi:hypothetical protein